MGLHNSSQKSLENNEGQKDYSRAVFESIYRRINQSNQTKYDHYFRRLVLKIQNDILWFDKEAFFAMGDIRESVKKIMVLMGKEFAWKMAMPSYFCKGNVLETCDHIISLAHTTYATERNFFKKMLSSEELLDEEVDAGENNPPIDSEKDSKLQELLKQSDAAESEAVVEAEKLKERVLALVSAGEVDEKVAIAFLGRFVGFGDQNETMYPIYRMLTKNMENISDELTIQKDKEFVRVLDDLKGSMPENVRYDKKNVSYRFGHKEGPCSYRIYISPKISTMPGGLMGVLERCLKKAGCPTVSHKTFKHLQFRNDQIVIYSSGEEGKSVELALRLFMEECPQEWISDESLSTGMEIRPGITFGVEPNGLNNLANRIMGDRYRNLDSFSYNSLIALITAMAYGFAYYDQYKGQKNESFSFDELQEGAYGYFTQMLKMTNINPATMMPMDLNEGQIPEWVKNLIKD